MELPIQTMDGNKDANKSIKNEGTKKGIRSRQGKTDLLRSRTEDQVEEEKEKVVTPGGKEIRIKMSPNSPHLKIVFYPGGEVPTELQGLYTDHRAANLAITAYLEKKNAKGSLRETD